jgi:glycerophosphoryl diester phosphodiesterase
MIKLTVGNVARYTAFALICSLYLSSCVDRKLISSVNMTPKNFDWQGHRGCRGLMPENTLVGFIHALKYPVTTLELDVVISKDGKVIVSHEPWMNHTICTAPNGSDIPESEEQQHNIYTLTLAEIRTYDCGSKGNPKFPRQQKIAATKPTLAEVVSAVKRHCQETGRTLPAFNIELKSHASAYGIFMPHPPEFVSIVLAELAFLHIEEHTILQSFDVKVLREIRNQNTDIRISYLAEQNQNFDEAISILGFIPQIYSPHFRLVSKRTVSAAHAQGMKVIPWTVNETRLFRKLIRLNVDGIITDYPDLIEALPDK